MINSEYSGEWFICTEMRKNPLAFYMVYWRWHCEPWENQSSGQTIVMCWLFWVSLWKSVSILCLCIHATATLLVPLWMCVAGASSRSLSHFLSHTNSPSLPFPLLRTIFFYTIYSIHTPSILPLTPPPLFAFQYVYESINIMPLIICAYQHVPHACGCGHQVRFINTETLDLTTTNISPPSPPQLLLLLLLLLFLLPLLLYFDFIWNVKLIQCWYVLQCMLAFSFTLTQTQIRSAKIKYSIVYHHTVRERAKKSISA